MSCRDFHQEKKELTKDIEDLEKQLQQDREDAEVKVTAKVNQLKMALRESKMAATQEKEKGQTSTPSLSKHWSDDTLYHVNVVAV